MPERGATEPGDVGELWMRRPEALAAGRTIPSVLEHAGDRVAVLQRNRGRLRGQVAHAGAPTAAGDRAIVGSSWVGRATDSSEDPTQLGRLLRCVSASIHGLTVLCAAAQSE